MKWLFGAIVIVSVAVACGGSSSNAVSVAPSNDAGSGAPAESGAPKDAGSANNADTGTSTDAGTTSQDAGLPPAVTVQFGNCSAFTACGGDPTGVWDYTAACVDQSALAALASNCQGAEMPTINSVTGTTQGRLTITATTVTRDVLSHATADVTLPKSCLGAEGEAATCPQIGGFIGLQEAGASCIDGGDAEHCDCTVPFTTGSSGTATYTINNDELDLSDGSIYDYCVDGATLTTTQTTAATGDPPQLGLLTATMEGDTDE